MDSLHLSSTYRFLRRSALSLFTPMLLGGIVITPGLLIPEAARAQPANSFNTQQLLQEGDQNADVLKVQKMLVELNYLNINIPSYAREGFFGPETHNAIRQFQRDSKLTVDGIAGPKTLSRLFGLSNPDRPNIAFMQAQLRELGYYGGKIDGQLGQGTANALRRMQAETFLKLSPRERRVEEMARDVNEFYLAVMDRRNLATISALESQVRREIGSVGGDSSEPWPIIPAWSDRDRSNKPYVVMVPYRGNYRLLGNIRDVAPDALVKAHRRGEYIYVGSFDERGRAEDLKEMLEQEGFLGARIIFIQ